MRETLQHMPAKRTRIGRQKLGRRICYWWTGPQATSCRAVGVSTLFRSYGTCREAGRGWAQAGLRGYRAGVLGRASADGD